MRFQLLYADFEFREVNPMAIYVFLGLFPIPLANAVDCSAAIKHLSIRREEPKSFSEDK